MARPRSLRSLSSIALLTATVLPAVAGAQLDPRLYAGLVWRNVGPFRGGRIASVTGAIGQPGVFYAGLPAGGIWKTTSAGETWYPVFDSVTVVSSVGAIEAAPSDPSVIYAGTGDYATSGAVDDGNGVYKSVDAGRTWEHLGLDATKHIPSILVDPRDPNLVMIAALGNVRAKSDVRGVFRSSDGGRTWSKTLYVDDETGIQKIAWAYDRPAVIFATSVRHYFAPGAPPRRGTSPDTGRTGTALFKSTDEGVTWHEITGGGLPRLAGRTSVAVAMNTDAQRVYLIGDFGLYRSDDGGTTWRQMDPSDKRVGNGQGGYNCGVYVDPKNPDIVYTINTSSYKSTDGGNNFTGFKGAPGGDDPQQMWIDPTNGQRILLGTDQGATITLDGGANWSSWYNQSTEQVYHLSTDNSFPYWIYATQQDAGAVATRNRGNLGEITPLDWKPVPGWEWGTIVPDPNDNDIVYASGSGIVKITYPTEQWINVSPAIDPGLKLRTSFSQPIVWAPWNKHELIAGFQYLMSTTDGGVHWTQLSPDLGIPKGGLAALTDGNSNSGRSGPPTGGTIETICASTVAPGTIWVGTNNGLIQVTRDGGKTWQDVSVPGLPNAQRADVSTIDASHSDAAGAYVAIDAHGAGDYTPYVYRTHDYGRTWTRIANGVPTDVPRPNVARVVRADTKRPGLLFLGTEAALYVSFDDGDHWQSLMLNLPTTSYRDITIHGNDLVVGTYGRGIWILDDYTVLRQITPAIASEPAHLFKPDEAMRVRRNVNADTPFPPEVPHALNPPEGALVYYSLAARPSAPVTLDVFDAAGGPVRHLSSVPEPPVPEAARPPEPNFWIAPPYAIPASDGLNRAHWDLRYDAPPSFTHSFEINANPGLTPPSPEGPVAPPGTYTLKLTAGGRSYTQTMAVRNDPRSTATAAAIEAQHALQMKLYSGMQTTWSGYQQIAAVRAALARLAGGTLPADVQAAATALDAKLLAVAGDTAARRGRGPAAGAPPPTFVSVNAALARGLEGLDYADMAPNEVTLRAWAATCADLKTATSGWKTLLSTELPAFNAMLSRNGLHPIAAPTPPSVPSC